MLRPRHEAYIREALRLREKYSSSIRILIGFEGEWIRPSYASLIHELSAHPEVDFFIGSVHHVHEIPIDFDRAMYLDARKAAGGSEQRLFEDYFDAQYEMLRATRPLVVAHFDLIRLLSDVPDWDFMQDENLASVVARNLRLMVELGALMEVNSSALRKGLKEPYPGRSICEV
jgi:histidinol-phosphatase (PHP family)